MTTKDTAGKWRHLVPVPALNHGEEVHAEAKPTTFAQLTLRGAVPEATAFACRSPQCGCRCGLLHTVCRLWRSVPVPA